MTIIRKQRHSRNRLKPIKYAIGLVLIIGYLSFLNHSIKVAHNSHDYDELAQNDNHDGNHSELSQKSKVQKDEEHLRNETKTPIAYGK